MSNTRRLYVAWREDHESQEPDEVFEAGYSAGATDLAEAVGLLRGVVDGYTETVESEWGPDAGWEQKDGNLKPAIAFLAKHPASAPAMDAEIDVVTQKESKQ